MAIENTLILYTREGCHLCEHAASMLTMLGIDWRPVDIETDTELENKYGLSIPVVFSPRSGRELAFPFDVQALAEFSEKGSI